MFTEAGKRGLARMIVINKMDADNIKFTELLTAIQDTFGKGCVLFNAPIGQGVQFSGVVSVLNPPDKPPSGKLLANRPKHSPWSRPNRASSLARFSRRSTTSLSVT